MKKQKFNPAALTATIASVMAITASVGFTGYFSYRVGLEHCLLLAILSATFAVSLDLMKPLAVHSALRSLTSFQFVKGLLCLLLAFVAIIYSLSSEISLMSTSRGDLIAKRENTIAVNKEAFNTYERWKQQLRQLSPSRPAAELQAKIHSIESLPGILINGKPCGGIYNGIVTKTNCPIRSDLIAELGRAKKRTELEELILGYQRNQKGNKPVKQSDPGSECLSIILLSLFGLKIEPQFISQWLPVIGVIGLELASSLGLVLVNSLNGSSKSVQAVPPQPDTNIHERVGRRLVNELQGNGGSIAGSERKLARKFNTSKSTLRRTLNNLMSKGLVATTVKNSGTTIHLL